jgi:hypothetical protein
MKRLYPKTWGYLLETKELLANREHGKFKATGWYQLYPKNLDFWEQPKILVPYMITDLAAFYDEGNLYFVNVTTGGFGITFDSGFGSLKYFTGLLNSRLLDWCLKRVSTSSWLLLCGQQTVPGATPIRPIDRRPRRRRAHDRMVALVTRMLALHRRLRRRAGR